MITSNAWDLPGSGGETILGKTDTPADEPRGVMLICHGFKGYMDYGFFPRLARDAAAAGLIAHRFNFSHSGMTRAVETFERPDLFERDTWGRQVEDLGRVASAAASGALPGGGLPQAWFGHSRGGLTVTLAAARAFRDVSAGSTRPAAVITAASPDAPCSLSEADRDTLRRQGRLLSPSGRTGQRLFVGRDWLAEIEANPAALDPRLAAASVPCPVLVLHGGEDRTVAVTAALALSQRYPRVELEVIGGASHTFDCPNPLPLDAEPPTATRRMIDRAVAFAAAPA